MNLTGTIIFSLIISFLLNSASFAMHEIHRAVVAGDLDRVRELIHADPNVGNIQTLEFRYSPLHFATNSGREDIVKFLLQNGAAINALNKMGYIPLHEAVLSQLPNVVLALLAHGSPINAQGGYSRGSPLHFVKEENTARILLGYNADVNIRDWIGRTPLQCKALNGASADLGRILLVHGAAIDVQDDYGKTALQIAEENCRDDFAQLLRDWPLYRNFLRRQIFAFVLVRHPRLGEHSPACVLDLALRQYISAIVAYPLHTLEEIHEMAEQERRIQQSAQQ